MSKIKKQTKKYKVYSQQEEFHYAGDGSSEEVKNLPSNNEIVEVDSFHFWREFLFQFKGNRLYMPPSLAFQTNNLKWNSDFQE